MREFILDSGLIYNKQGDVKFRERGPQIRQTLNSHPSVLFSNGITGNLIAETELFRFEFKHLKPGGAELWPSDL